MLRGIAAFPGVVPVVRADARMQVIGLDDLAETVARALAPDAPAKTVWEVAHPQVHRLADIVAAIRFWLGFPPRRVLALPDAFARAVAAVADALGFLGWRSPARTTSFAQLTAGVIGDPSRWMAETGIAPKSLDQILAARPTSVQDRWFARLYLLKPLAILGLAIATIVPNAERLAAYLGIGSSSFGGRPMLFAAASSVVALLAGLSLAVRPAARCALLVLLALTLLQLAGLRFRPSITFVGLLDVVAFTLPMVLLILFTLGILDDR
jgi:class 3 adenylate cyclase